MLGVAKTSLIGQLLREILDAMSPAGPDTVESMGNAWETRGWLRRVYTEHMRGYLGKVGKLSKLKRFGYWPPIKSRCDHLRKPLGHQSYIHTNGLGKFFPGDMMQLLHYLAPVDS